MKQFRIQNSNFSKHTAFQPRFASRENDSFSFIACTAPVCWDFDAPRTNFVNLSGAPSYRACLWDDRKNAGPQAAMRSESRAPDVFCMHIAVQEFDEMTERRF